MATDVRLSELIRKKYAEGVTPAEAEELHWLKIERAKRIEAAAPRDCDTLDAQHQRLQAMKEVRVKRAN